MNSNEFYLAIVGWPNRREGVAAMWAGLARVFQMGARHLVGVMACLQCIKAMISFLTD